MWADEIRKDRYSKPTHSHKENLELYAHLNEVAAELLATGQDVIFDTNFNFYKDRRHLREIAAKQGAVTRLIWVVTPKAIARQRATENVRYPYEETFPEDRFDRISSNLQKPKDDESYIEIDGTRVTPAYVREKLALV